MLSLIGLPTLPILRCHITGPIDVWQLMPTSARSLCPASIGVLVGQRVGGVRVAAAGAAQHLFAVRGDERLGLPAVAVALELAGERGVDDAVVEAPDEDRRHEPAVLAAVVHLVVGCPHEQDVAVDAGHLVGLGAHGRRGARWPRAPRAGSGGTPACRTCSPSDRDRSRPGRAPPRGGRACTCPARGGSRSRRAGTRSRSPRTPCTGRS